MSEFAKAKVKRENFESHNDKAIKLVEDLLNSKDSKDRESEALGNINIALVDIKNGEEQANLLNSLVVRLALLRDNNLIEKFLKHLENTEYWMQAFHALVLKLTCNDDCHTLDTVLRYGKDNKLEPDSSGGNPIALASEQVSCLFYCGKQNIVMVFRDIFSAPRSCMVLDTGSPDQSPTKSRTQTSQTE